MLNYFGLTTFVCAFICGPLVVIAGGYRYLLVKKVDKISKWLLAAGIMLLVAGFLLMIVALRHSS